MAARPPPPPPPPPPVPPPVGEVVTVGITKPPRTPGGPAVVALVGDVTVVALRVLLVAVTGAGTTFCVPPSLAAIRLVGAPTGTLTRDAASCGVAEETCFERSKNLDSILLCSWSRKRVYEVGRPYLSVASTCSVLNSTSANLFASAIAAPTFFSTSVTGTKFVKVPKSPYLPKTVGRFFARSCLTLGVIVGITCFQAAAKANCCSAPVNCDSGVPSVTNFVFSSSTRATA